VAQSGVRSNTQENKRRMGIVVRVFSL